MSINMNLEASKEQAESISMIYLDQNNKFNELIHALNRFSYYSNSLDGKAFNSLKDANSSFITPLIKGFILYNEEMIKVSKQLHQLYENSVDKKSWNEIDLENQINNLRNRVQYFENLKYYYNSSQNYLYDYYFKNQIQLFKNFVYLLEKKLRALRQFHHESANLFAKIHQLRSDLQRGIHQFQNRLSSGIGGSCMLEDIEWRLNINSLFSNREISDEEVNLLQSSVLMSHKIEEESEPLTKNHLFRRLELLIELVPTRSINKILQSDGFWSIAQELSEVNQTRLINLLARFEEFKNGGTFLSKTLHRADKVFDFVSTVTSPIKGAISKTLNSGPVTKYITKLAKNSGKFIGKVGTVLTYAQLGANFVGGAIDEFSKSNDVGKAVIAGSLDAVKTIGPLEGLTIGATFGGPVGAVIGGGFGLLNSGVQFVFPDGYDYVKEGMFELYEGAKNIGKGVVDQTVSMIDNVSKGLNDVGNAVTEFVSNIKFPDIKLWG